MTSLRGELVRNIGQLADVAAERRGQGGGVEVRISFDRTDPPVGQLWGAPAPDDPSSGVVEPIPFTGWLGLLRALSDIVGDPDGGPPAAD